MPSPQALVDLPRNHPCLWGEVETAPEALWVLEPQALLVRTRRTGHDGNDWWKTRKQGGRDRNGRPIQALTDHRGGRAIYPLPARDKLPETSRANGSAKPTLLYGGSLFDHFGHLVLDLSRTYQLLRLFRNSSEPIWFHYPSGLSTPRNTRLNDGAVPQGGIASFCTPLILEWLRCLGLDKRARLIRKNLQGDMLVSSSVLYRDRRFVTSDFPKAAQAALAPPLRKQLLRQRPECGRIAYLSRHKLQGGTTRFVGEEQVVEAITGHPHIDVICAEELSIEQKLALYRRYALIAGFPQACMNLKCFVPYHDIDDLARQVMFIAGPKSLSSNWVNLDRSCGFGDGVVDCSAPGTTSTETEKAPDAAGFQRCNHFDAQLVVETLHALAG